jgi:predicted nicotinamide N-methyase
MAVSQDPFQQIHYHVKRQTLEVGGSVLDIETLDNLNDTIDQVFAILEKDGRPELLEKLCPYFGVIWPSAMALSLAIARMPDAEIRGLRILELGCGLALPSLLAASRGARCVATDFHPEVPRFLESNCRLNGVEVEYVPANWMAPEGSETLASRGFDLVMGSDILYERHYARPVAEAFRRFAPSGSGIRVWLADPGRPYLQAFHDAMRSVGLPIETEILRAPGPDPREIFLLTSRA